MDEQISRARRAPDKSGQKVEDHTRLQRTKDCVGTFLFLPSFGIELLHRRRSLHRRGQQHVQGRKQPIRCRSASTTERKIVRLGPFQPKNLLEKQPLPSLKNPRTKRERAEFTCSHNAHKTEAAACPWSSSNVVRSIHASWNPSFKSEYFSAKTEKSEGSSVFQPSTDIVSSFSTTLSKRAAASEHSTIVRAASEDEIEKQKPWHNTFRRFRDSPNEHSLSKAEHRLGPIAAST